MFCAFKAKPDPRSFSRQRAIATKPSTTKQHNMALVFNLVSLFVFSLAMLILLRVYHKA
jgi:hypothetical protein